MAGTVNPLSLTGGRQNFYNRFPMSRYQTGANPRTDGTMNVADATNAGYQVQPWANSSGVGQDEGYRGGYGGYRGGYGGYRGGRYHGYGREERPPTKRPSASTADEYYRNRDAAVGNPLDMLKLHGPEGGNLMANLIAEARVGNGGAGQSTTQDNGYGTMIKNGQQVPMTAADMAGVQQQSTGTHIPNVGDSTLTPKAGGKPLPMTISRPFDLQGAGVRLPSQIVRSTQPPSPLMPEGYEPSPEGFTAQTPEQSNPQTAWKQGAVSQIDSARDAKARKMRADQMALVESQMSGGKFTPGNANVSRVGRVINKVAENTIDPAANLGIWGIRKGKSMWDYLFRPPVSNE